MNYAFTTGRTLPTVENGHVFEGGNFHRAAPHTAVFAGVTGLTFRRCNLINCDIPADAVIEDCNRGHVSYCSHEHPRWLEKGAISECVQECEHFTGTDLIQVGGVTVETIYHYSDKVVA